MKKLFSCIILGIIGISFSQAQCVDFGSKGQVCVSISALGGNSYQVNPTSNSFIACDILTPDGVLTNIGACNKTFQYAGNGTQTIKLYIKLDNDFKIGTFNYTFGGNGSLTTITTPTSIPSNWYNTTLTVGQTRTINDVIKLRPTLISTLKIRFPKLATNSTRQTLADTLGSEMQKLVNGSNPRIYNNYKSFRDSLIAFVQYTISVR